MKALFLSLWIAVLVLPWTGRSGERGDGRAGLPGAEQVLERYVAALGGTGAVQRLTTRVIKGLAEGNLFKGQAHWEYIAEAPNRRLSILEVPGLGSVVDGFDGAVAWRRSANLPAAVLAGEELAKARRDAEFHRDSNLKKIYPDLTVTGETVVSGEESYVVEGKPSARAVERFYFSKKSGLLARQDSEFETPAGRVVSTALYDDYRVVDGVKIPFLMRVRASGTGTGGRDLEFTIKFLEVRHNVPVDESRFQKPQP
jgi:hypothetical protein